MFFRTATARGKAEQADYAAVCANEDSTEVDNIDGDRDDNNDGDRDDNDDGNVDIYIMMQCLFVCHEKWALPPGSLL